MSTQPVVNTTLEQRITARLHESIGDLITDDDLKAIVARGIEQALFKERPDLARATSYHTYTKPPLVDELVAKLLTEKMETAVNAWLTENPDAIRAALDTAISLGVGTALLRSLDNRFAGIFDAGVSTLQNRGLLPRGQ